MALCELVNGVEQCTILLLMNITVMLIRREDNKNINSKVQQLEQIC